MDFGVLFPLLAAIVICVGLIADAVDKELQRRHDYRMKRLEGTRDGEAAN